MSDKKVYILKADYDDSNIDLLKKIISSVEIKDINDLSINEDNNVIILFVYNRAQIEDLLWKKIRNGLRLKNPVILITNFLLDPKKPSDFIFYSSYSYSRAYNSIHIDRKVFSCNFISDLKETIESSKPIMNDALLEQSIDRFFDSTGIIRTILHDVEKYLSDESEFGKQIETLKTYVTKIQNEDMKKKIEGILKDINLNNFLSKKEEIRVIIK